MEIAFMLSVALTFFSTQGNKCLEDQQCSNCSSVTQYCSTDCFPGYFGLRCKSRCSNRCINSKCSQTPSGAYTCSDGCVPGFYGTGCNIPCARPEKECTKCPDRCDGTFCNLTSSCVFGCHDQYYGTNCKSCSPRCRHCNRITGRCDVCHDPYHGLDCEYSCEHCSTTDCVQTCAPGLYGRTCSKRCSKNCLAYTASKSTLTSNGSAWCISECHRYNGECINGCADDWSGPHCSTPIKCNPACLGCNETGVCVEGCLSGYFGDACKPCPRNCFNYTCYPHNGSCDNGCIPGQYGESCELPCLNCPGGVCHPISGICIQESTVHILGLGLSTGCVFLIVSIVCMSVLHFRRRRQTTGRDQQADAPIHTERPRQVNTGEYYAIHRYCEIEDNDVVPQPQDQQEGTPEEDDYDEVSQRQWQQQGLAVEEDKNVPALPALVDKLPKSQDSEYDDGIPVLPVLADYFPGAQATEDNSGSDISPCSARASHSYTHLMRDVFVDDSRTVVTYISPTDENT